MTVTTRKASWVGVSLAVFTAAWGGNEFTPLLVMYRENSHISGVIVDTLLFTYVLGIIPALLIGGPLSDRFGRRPLMLPSPIIAAAGSALLAAGAHSVPMLAAGRVLSGIALGLAMAVGGSWIKELSDRDGAASTAGARRAALSLTAGFGLGAAVAALLAQWGPWPNQLAYLVNIALAVIALVLLWPTPETRLSTGSRGGQAGSTGGESRLIDDLKIPSAKKPRFWLTVAPTAPWVFGTCAMAYAVIPALMTQYTQGWAIVFAGLCCLLGLTAGFLIQTVGRKIDRPGSPRANIVAMTLACSGMLLAALAASLNNIYVGLFAAIILGSGYGMTLITGLLETQRLAGPTDLAGLTAVFYGLTYLGFAAPAIMAWIHETYSIGYPAMFIFGAVMTLVCLAIVVVAKLTAPPVARYREEHVVLD